VSDPALCLCKDAQADPIAPVNLPIGAISVAFIGFLLKAQPPPTNPHFPRPGWRKFLDLDWVGTILCVGMTTCLLLPLQEGGNTKPWSDPTVYALFPVFGVLLAAFIGWEWRMGPRAILPLAMFKRRTQIGCCLEAVSPVWCITVQDMSD
jgi:hypothetical protein